MTPFRRLPFESVPELPAVAHRWADVARRDVEIETESSARVASPSTSSATGHRSR